MKKKLLCLLLATSTLCLLTACGDKKQPDTTEANPGEAIVGEEINDLNPGDVAIVTITLNEEIPMVRGTEVFYQTANGIADSAACIASPVEE